MFIGLQKRVELLLFGGCGRWEWMDGGGVGVVMEEE